MSDESETGELNTSDKESPVPSGLKVPAQPSARKPILDERSWTMLLRAIKAQRCTPFLGPEVAFGGLPVKSRIAKEWVAKYGYPMEDSEDLARVAQFIATEYDKMFPKNEIIEKFNEVQCPDLANPDEPHRVLANLPLPVYITTNYDDFLTQALKTKWVGDTKVPYKDPRRELCRWNDFIVADPSVFDTDFEPSVANPVVFHLYGHTGAPESLILTEDDYLDFLVSVSRYEHLIPARIQKALTRASLLFLGYRFTDLDFRVLLRGLVNYLEKNLYVRSKAHVSIQVVAVGDAVSISQRESIETYLSKYCGKMDIEVGLGTCAEFASELRKRWEAEGGMNNE